MVNKFSVYCGVIIWCPTCTYYLINPQLFFFILLSICKTLRVQWCLIKILDAFIKQLLNFDYRLASMNIKSPGLINHDVTLTLCHKCYKYNCLPWKMLDHTGNSYITCRKQLCHAPYTVMPHRRQLYHPLMYLFCILIRSSLWSTTPLLSKVNRSGNLKWNKELSNSVFHFIWLCFYLKCHITYITSSRATIPEYKSLVDTKALVHYVTSADILVCHPGSHVLYVYSQPHQ